MEKKLLKFTKNKNITYHDIKKETNLGIGTISRFFNNGPVSEEAKNKIEKFIKENDYIPNIGAKLIKGHEDCVYLITCSITESSIQNILNNIILNFKNININVYVVVASYCAENYLNVLKQTISRKPKNLILLTPPMNDELKEFINNIEINTIIYGEKNTNKPSIYLDEKNIIKNLAFDILNDNKYKNIIYFGKDFADINTGKKRFEGFLEAIENKNINFSKYFIKENNFPEISKEFEKIKNTLDDQTIIVCGTHTIFKYCYFEKINNSLNYSLTDIGYKSLFDYFPSYKYKIFIDFFEIALKMFEMFQNKITTNQKVNGIILKK